jgi:LAO/AO transport system kinase
LIVAGTIEPAATQAIADKVLAGDVRVAARLMRDLDDGMPAAVAALKRLYPSTGRAFVLGVTGNPGAGKSTLVDGLIERYRQQGLRVGVVAVDPTSPFSGGAILGDRIRMSRHATDPGVFIRSLATRGHMGGLSRSTADVVTVLDAMGFAVVIVETVGVGQDEIEIAAQAETTVVVTVPGLGDEVQAIKAGILEIADVLVVNKADREGADRSVRDLHGMLELRAPGAPPVEVVKTVASSGGGLDELVAAIDRHRVHAGSPPPGQAPGEAPGEVPGEVTDPTLAAAAPRRRKRAEAMLIEVVHDRLLRAADEALVARADLRERVASRATDPYTAAEELLAGLLSRR